MPSIFSRIVAGEVPCHKVFENEGHLAFLDVSPVQPGHVLVVPKKEVAYLFDLSTEEYEGLWHAVRKVEEGLRRATKCRRVCVAVVGWEVAHVHVHLIPTNRAQDFPLPPKAAKQTPEQLERTAAEIRRAIEG